MKSISTYQYKNTFPFSGLLSCVCLIFLFTSFRSVRFTAREKKAITYYIDSKNGKDQNRGTSRELPWKTLSHLSRTTLLPGDSIRFKRGASFTGPLIIGYSGEPGRYITVTDYGSAKVPAPAFSNPVFEEGNYGNCIRIKGSYVIVENLYFNNTAAYVPVPYNGNGWPVWEMGAIHIDSTARNCIVRNNEIKDCVAGIRSNGEHARIEHNYIHDCNRVLKEWNWGPIGIWMGADYQEVCYNRIFNYSVVDPRIHWGPDAYGGGADGGALEIDDARHDKSHISIHHNYTRDCQGFLEVTWTDVKQNPAYKNFAIHHNVSDDYQQFIALWRGEACRIENNTIIRRKVNANDWGVFNITQFHSHNLIRNNIIVVEKNVVIFNLGKRGNAQPQNIISHNLYFAASGNLNMGKEGPGDSAVFGDPMFENYERARTVEDFSITRNSPAIDKGLNAGYSFDFVHTKIPQLQRPDIGAFEYKSEAGLSSSGILLAKNGKAFVSVELPEPSSVTQQYAAEELCQYLKKISGADFQVNQDWDEQDALIKLEKNKQLEGEDYRIFTRNQNIILQGGSDRALLYAAYVFLKRLGCCWLAPQFSFYKGSAEYVPKKNILVYDGSDVVHEHPRFALRKLDVEEGRSHTTENLKQMIEWMPKVRLNILMVPLNYQGAGRVEWDNWREELTPELKKRGLLLEIGGHGYQNFLNSKMEDGALFKDHPNWFGENKSGVPDPAQNIVFNTSNPDAVDYFISNISTYIKNHPEIDIFDLWPPDGARWALAPELVALGDPADRQARLVNKVDNKIKKIRPGLRLEIIAYGQVLQPPQSVALNPDIFVDICPINQSFERPVFDSANENNSAYAKVINDWRDHFPGNIGLYSYYRKYAWRSLPIVFPNYIQRDMNWYANRPLQGISTYAEPGDWFTYELNHYALAALAWNPQINVDSLVDQYCALRYGRQMEIASAAYEALENLVPAYSSIPYTTIKSSDEIVKAETKLALHRKQISEVIDDAQNKTGAMNLSRLLLMMDYAIYDLKIMKTIASAATSSVIEDQVRQMVQFLHQNSSKGVFIVSGENYIDRLLIYYSRKATEISNKKTK